jgi:hypothetical protein
MKNNYLTSRPKMSIYPTEFLTTSVTSNYSLLSTTASSTVLSPTLESYSVSLAILLNPFLYTCFYTFNTDYTLSDLNSLILSDKCVTIYSGVCYSNGTNNNIVRIPTSYISPPSLCIEFYNIHIDAAALYTASAFSGGQIQFKSLYPTTTTTTITTTTTTTTITSSFIPVAVSGSSNSIVVIAVVVTVSIIVIGIIFFLVYYKSYILSKKSSEQQKIVITPTSPVDTPIEPLQNIIIRDATYDTIIHKNDMFSDQRPPSYTDGFN